MDQVERQFGKGYIMRLGGRMLVEIPVISTGSLALDHALGVGGIPRGESLKYSDLSPEERPHWPFTSWPKLRNGVV